MSTQVTGTLEFDNKSTDVVFALQQPTTAGDTQIGNFSDLPVSLKPNANTAKCVVVFNAGAFETVTNQQITIGYSISNAKDASKALNGTFKMYFSGGTSYPDFLNFEVDFKDQQGTQQQGFTVSIPLSSTDEATLPAVNFGSLNILLNDNGLTAALNGGGSQLSNVLNALIMSVITG